MCEYFYFFFPFIIFSHFIQSKFILSSDLQMKLVQIQQRVNNAFPRASTVRSFCSRHILKKVKLTFSWTEDAKADFVEERKDFSY